MSSRKSDRAEWGSLTRKGASYVEGRQEPSRYEKPPRPEKPGVDPRLRAEAKEAIERGNKNSRGPKPNKRSKLPKVPLNLADPAEALRKALGGADGDKALIKLERASQSFANERFEDARKSLKSIAAKAPDVAEVRELHGLTLYRMGKWKQAAAELEAFRDLSGTTEQHPVLADCYRAMQRWADVDELWDELKQSSPNADLVTEGRIVAAGALSDQGDRKGAIALLEQGWKQPKKAKPHHLARAYALADLYEQAGKAARARELFGWLVRQDKTFGDVTKRLDALR